MTEAALQTRREKFRDPDWTAAGERRAQVPLDALQTLWINTGSLCNIECRNCYIESSPENDRLAYISRAEVSAFLDEIEREALPTREIGFTGGEPFMNPAFLAMLGLFILFMIWLVPKLWRGVRALFRAPPRPNYGA